MQLNLQVSTRNQRQQLQQQHQHGAAATRQASRNWNLTQKAWLPAKSHAVNHQYHTTTLARLLLVEVQPFRCVSMPHITDAEAVTTTTRTKSIPHHRNFNISQRQSQHSDIARAAIMRRSPPSKAADLMHLSAEHRIVKDTLALPSREDVHRKSRDGGEMAPPPGRQIGSMPSVIKGGISKDGIGRALTDTPLSTAPNTAPSSPRM